MTAVRSLPSLRFLAFAIDWVLIAAWGGLLFGAAMMVTGGRPPDASTPWISQLIGFAAMTVPATLYFAACESSVRRASLGKLALGLVVSRATGERLTFGRALLRHSLKFIPWELGHTAAHRAVFAGADGPTIVVWVAATAALLGLAWWAVSLVATGRTPYDRWTSSVVRRSTP